MSETLGAIDIREILQLLPHRCEARCSPSAIPPPVLNHPGWLYLAVAERPSISAAARSAAWRC